jgi:hypothetical protein
VSGFAYNFLYDFTYTSGSAYNSFLFLSSLWPCCLLAEMINKESPYPLPPKGYKFCPFRAPRRALLTQENSVSFTRRRLVGLRIQGSGVSTCIERAAGFPTTSRATRKGTAAWVSLLGAKRQPDKSSIRASFLSHIGTVPPLRHSISSTKYLPQQSRA